MDELADDVIELRAPAGAGPDLSWGYVLAITLRGTAVEVGRVILRVDHADEGLVAYAGHIAFEVAREHRGHRYAVRACRLLRSLARCHGFAEDNPAALATIALLGARYVDTAVIPEHRTCADWESPRCDVTAGYYELSQPCPMSCRDGFRRCWPVL